MKSLKFNIKPLRPNWGAIITGIDLSKKVDKDIINWILTNVHKYRLLIFKK